MRLQNLEIISDSDINQDYVHCTFESHCVHLKLVHQFHALLKVCSDCDDIVPLSTKTIITYIIYSMQSDGKTATSIKENSHFH